MSGTSDHVFCVPISSTKFFPEELEQNPNPKSNPAPSSAKKRRNLPGTPDPDAEVMALSPGTLMAKNRFMCEICNKGFQRDQNLQLHRRGHNLPWKLKQRGNKEQIKKKVYICPEKTCVHHDPARALGDLTGVKKHYSRKHGEKKWKCDKCSKKYAVQSDWKAHSKTCGTREYKCDCGTLFSRRDSFITHRAFCDALAEESARNMTANIIGSSNNLMNFRINHEHGGRNLIMNLQPPINNQDHINNAQHKYSSLPLWLDHQMIPRNTSTSNSSTLFNIPDPEIMGSNLFSKGNNDDANNTIYAAPPMSATALLQKAAQMGSTKSNPTFSGKTVGVMMNTTTCETENPSSFTRNRSELHQVFGMLDQNGLTRDFLGMGRGDGDTFFSPELAKFVSMSSPVGLSHFTGKSIDQ